MSSDKKTDLVAVRDDDGRFVKGQSGNPAGRPIGSKNRITVLKVALEEAFRDETFEDVLIILKQVVADAKAGDKSARKMVWDSAVSKGMLAQDKDAKTEQGFTVHHMHHDVDVNDKEGKDNG